MPGQDYGDFSSRTEYYDGMSAQKLQQRDESPDPPQLLCCNALLPIAAGYCAAFLALLEGIVIIFNVTGVIDRERGWFKGLDENNPFANVEWKLLGIMGWGDLGFAIIGSLGLWLSMNVVPLNWRSLDRNHAYVANTCVSLFLFWRTCVAVIIAPWVGIMLAFEPESYDKAPFLFWTVLYVTVSMYVVWVLFGVARAMKQEGNLVQEFIDLSQAEERRELIRRAQQSGDVSIPDNSEFFGCFPLEPTLAVYMLAATILYFMCVLWLLGAGKSIGGWAFMTSVPNVSMTYGLEVFVYLLSAAFSLLGFFGIIFFRSAMDSEEDAKTNLAQSAGRGAMPTYSEDLDESTRVKRRCSVAILMYLVASISRFALFVPITGMVLLEKNICGYYVRGLSSVSISKSVLGMPPLHCTGEDYMTLLFIVGGLLLDLYTVYGVGQLWFIYRSSTGLTTQADTILEVGTV